MFQSPPLPEPPVSISHPFYTIAEVAKDARRTERSLRQLIVAGRGPKVTRIGGRLLIRGDHLAEWLEEAAA